MCRRASNETFNVKKKMKENNAQASTYPRVDYPQPMSSNQ